VLDEHEDEEIRGNPRTRTWGLGPPMASMSPEPTRVPGVFCTVSGILCTMREKAEKAQRAQKAEKAAAYPGDLLDHLRAFAHLCASVERSERAAFARTANALALDVSVLRRRMQTLATFIGAPLVEGRGNRLRLTAAGGRVRVNAVRTLEAAAELALVDDESGPLRIACTGTVITELLPPALGALRDAYPKLSFRVRRAGAEAALALVERGETDFAILRAGARPRWIHIEALGGRPPVAGLRVRDPARDEPSTGDAFDRRRTARRLRGRVVDDEASHGRPRSAWKRAVDRGRRESGCARVRRSGPRDRFRLRRRPRQAGTNGRRRPRRHSVLRADCVLARLARGRRPPAAASTASSRSSKRPWLDGHREAPEQKQKAREGFPLGLIVGELNRAINNPGDVLLSHTATRAVPSAPKSLTSEFGMGSGVASSKSSPEICG
jgi:DNA-binding transcriptional LysR family regulator